MSLPAILLNATLCLVAQGNAITWEQSGGGFEPGNLAGPAAAAVAFGKDEASGPNRIANVNDLVFGSRSAWIGKTNGSFVGVRLAERAIIDRIAFGRDNTAKDRDRVRGTYTLQYTTTKSPDAATADTDWKTIAVLDYAHPLKLASVPYHQTGLFARNVYRFAPVEATGVRIITRAAAKSPLLAIDELEVYGPDSARTLAAAEAAYAERIRSQRAKTALPRPQGPITTRNLISDPEYQWLDDKARAVLAAVRFKMNDGTIVYSPGVYVGFWPRDCYYLISAVPDSVPPEQVRDICRLILRSQRADGVVTKQISPNGRPVWCVFGPPPEGDSAQFLVKLAYEYYQRSGDRDFVRENLDKLRRAMDSMPRDDKGLVWIDPKAPHTSYGFDDLVVKTGADLFCSLLYWETSRQLAEMAGAIGRQEVADDFLARAKRIETNLDALWDSERGAYVAATGIGRQIDVWGNAYAVYLDFPTAHRKLICRWLADHYSEIVYAGQVRHLPAPEHWQKMDRPVRPGEYQNGAYWGTASGWVAYAIAQVDPPLASRMLGEMIDFYRNEGVYECVAPSGYRKYFDYAATVGGPLLAVRRMRGGSICGPPGSRSNPRAAVASESNYTSRGHQ